MKRENLEQYIIDNELLQYGFQEVEIIELTKSCPFYIYIYINKNDTKW